MTDEFDDSEGWTKLEYRTADGLTLAGRRYGWDHLDPMPVVCLPGLTRNSADFHDLALHLAYAAETPRRVLCLDYRGRGMSQYDRDWHNYNVLTEADDVLAGMTAAGLDGAAIIGTSRGGLIAFALTAMRPTVLRAVVFNDIGPQIEGTGLVRIKNYVEHARDFRRWEDAVEAVRSIGRHQFPDWDDAMWEKQAHLLFERHGRRRVRRRYDKRLMKTLKSLNLDNPLPQMWPQFKAMADLPIMVVRGENSDLLAAETVAEMAARHPGLVTLTVPNQGHAPDLGGAEVASHIADFLASVDAGTANSVAA